MAMSLRDRWVRYCGTMECEICGDSVYNTEEDAQADVDHILETNDFGPDPPIECLRDALTWFEHEGQYCPYHVHVLSKDC